MSGYRPGMASEKSGHPTGNETSVHGKIHGLGCYSSPHLCASYLSQIAISAGVAAEQAAVRKSEKYALYPATHVLILVAIETFGLVWQSPRTLGRTYSRVRHD